MHAVIRRYRVRLGTVDQAARHAERWFLPLVRKVPGFVACYLVATPDGVLASLGLFETAEAAEAALLLAHDWFRGEWGFFQQLPPEVIGGEVLAQAVASARSSTGRRRAADRRSVAGRHESERRVGADRRLVLDRRAEGARLLELRAAG